MSMPVNGDTHIDALLRGAAEQQRQQQMIQQALVQVMRDPARTTRLNLTIIALADEAQPEGPARKILMIATPSGERIEVPLAPQVAGMLHRALEPAEVPE